MPLTPGQSLSFYEILGPLGAGGMGEVYRARDTGLEREVAVMVLPEDLAERLKRGPLPVHEALDVCRQIAEGLEVAHEAGIVHRDLKPADVRITPEDVVKLLDFGLAKPIHAQSTAEGTSTAESGSFLVTEEGLLLGTPTYMSPEQARGKPVDRRTDILAAIVGEEPDLSLLPPLPASLRARSCAA
jgi:serine/threonine protein kinase